MLFRLNLVKAVSDVYMPADGKVVAVNEELNDAPELVKRISTFSWLALCN